MTALIDSFKISMNVLNPTGGPVLAAVSGGADSMALMHLLHRAEVPCAVAYFDQQTRQGQSAEDGRFVARARMGKKPIKGSPIVVNDLLVLASTDGDIGAFRIR